MFRKKIIASFLIFSILMIITSYIKTQTRIIEKKILSYEKKISNTKNNLHEAQLDFFYLSSPEYISKKIQEYSDEEYTSIKYSNIYFNLEQFLKEREKLTVINKNEKKFKKK